jgi:hypothetical protein
MHLFFFLRLENIGKTFFYLLSIVFNFESPPLLYTLRNHILLNVPHRKLTKDSKFVGDKVGLLNLAFNLSQYVPNYMPEDYADYKIGNYYIVFLSYLFVMRELVEDREL